MAGGGSRDGVVGVVVAVGVDGGRGRERGGRDCWVSLPEGERRGERDGIG